MAGIVNKTNFETYNKMYESMDAEHNYPNTNLVRLEKWFFKGKKGFTLDHGCGYGENSIFLANLGYKLISSDISKNLLKNVKKKINKKCVNPNLIQLDHIKKDDKKLNYPDSFFDYIVSLGVLEMLGERASAKKLIDEFYRCLKPGGKMIVSTIAMKNTFVQSAKKIRNETFQFVGLEKHKRKIKIDWYLYIPSNKTSFANIFNKKLNGSIEIGSWDNDYCGIEGKHLVALVEKSK